MGVIEHRQGARQQRINIIVKTLKAAFNDGLTLDKYKLLNECRKQFKLSDRTLNEYISVAITLADAILDMGVIKESGDEKKLDTFQLKFDD